MDLTKEQKIVEKSKKDKVFFKQIYTEYVDHIYRFCYSLVNNQTEAEDITSETFLKGLEKIDTFEYRGKSIKAWLFTIARNITYERYRKPRELNIPDGLETKISGKNDKSNSDPQLQKDIKESLEKLPEITKEIVILRIWESYKFGEIAKIVDKSEDAVKKQFYRALDKLKQDLEEKEYDKYLIGIPAISGHLADISKLNEFRASSEFIKKELENLISNNKINKINKLNKMKNLSKPLKITIGGVSSLLIAGSIGTIIWMYNKPVDSEPTDNNIEEAQTDIEDQEDVAQTTTETDIEDQEKIDEKTTNMEWKTYIDDDFENLTFKYPDGAEVTKVNTANNDPVCDEDLFFTITIKYKEIEYSISSFCGIGGQNSEAEKPYSVVYQDSFDWVDPRGGDYINEFEGIIENEYNNSDLIYYEPFYEDMMLPILGLTFVADGDDSILEDYSDISVEIAKSFWGVE